MKRTNLTFEKVNKTFCRCANDGAPVQRYRAVFSQPHSQGSLPRTWEFPAPSLAAAQQQAAREAGVQVSEWMPCALGSCSFVSFPSTGGALIVSQVENNCEK